MHRVFPRLRSAGTLAAIASIAAVAVLVPTAASAEPIGTIVQLSTFSPTTGTSVGGSASIATNPDSGVTLAAWAGTVNGIAVSAPINVAIIGANAVPGPTVTYQPADSMPAGAPSSRAPLSVSAGANGGFLVTWSGATTDNAIYGILVNSAGAFIGTAFAVSANTNYSDIETTSAAWSAADSRYLVTWKARVNVPFPTAANPQQLVGRFLDGAGVPLGADFLISNIVQEINDSQDVAYGGGAWLVVGVGNSDNVMRAVRVAPDGSVGAAIPVPAPTGTTNGAAVEFNTTTGQFLLVSKNSVGAWGQLVQPSGAFVGAPFAIDTVAGGGRPQVTAAGAAGWLVTWHSLGVRDIYAIELDGAGVPVGVPELMSSGANNPAVELNFRPEVAFSAITGQAYVIWSRRNATLNETNVVVRAWQAAEPAPLPALPAAGPALAATGVDAERSAFLAGAGALALLAGAVAIGARRRRTAVSPLV
jgi:hypothetical protein